MSLFGCSGSGVPTTSFNAFGLSGSNSGGGFSFGPVRSAASAEASVSFADTDDASEPFGRVESTHQCFMRNGRVATTSKWTPPSRPLFRSSQPAPSFGFHSSGGDPERDIPAFGYSSQPQTKSLFGSSSPVVGGFGASAGATVSGTSAANTNANSGFGFGSTGGGFGAVAGQAKSTSLFGTGISDVNHGFGASSVVFGAGSHTVKPPLAPSPSPFTTSTSTSTPFTSTTKPANPFASAVSIRTTKPANPFKMPMTTFGGSKAFSFGESTVTHSGASFSNPFAMKNASGSTSNPFAAQAALVSMSNPFATKNASGSTSNPFAVKKVSGSTSNPFQTSRLKQVSSSSVNPFATPFVSRSSVNPLAARVSPNTTVNPFSVATSDSSSSTKNPFAVAWSPEKILWSSSSTAGSASMKFKSRLRPAFRTGASPWSSSTQESSSAQPAPTTAFDWGAWGKKQESMQPSTESLCNMSNLSAGEEANTAAPTTETPTSSPDVLVASPDTNPYGSGSFGAGLVEQKVKAAITNPPTSIELKILDAPSSSTSFASMSCQQPSARFAAKLGLARQPLQATPTRPMLPRFSTARTKLPQADPFRFSNSFSRLAISKRAVTLQVIPRVTPVKRKGEAVGIALANAEVASPVKSNEQSDDEPEPAGHESGEDDEDQVETYASSSPAFPVLRSDKYFTEPSVGELQQLTEEELARVDNFVIGQSGCGKISFVGTTDLRGLVLDELVVFSDGGVVVYPDEHVKPDVGCALNKPAIVCLDGISAEASESHEDFLKRLERHTEVLGATFLGYDEDSQAGNGGVWSFHVEHF
ncbi:nuclear pore complex protein NUP98A isoform X3 [Phytophthora cinnamomi]|uniref:nuclear pore complex protein NUP98A isoform X3 n=1 Tax=Phytophthora cinnamomi TaxID=4785 RepID=UPI003559E006|nr:nuclear pore complex protein NUP98A isoform X3 [Phytophthora cinnamomi]